MGGESISSSDRAENWFERTRFCSAFFSLSEATGFGGTWGLLEGVERLGCENPSTSTRTLSTLTLVGEHLEDDESSFEVAVFKGPAEPLGALLEGAAEPLDAILWGLAEPLEVFFLLLLLFFLGGWGVGGGGRQNPYPSPKNT